MSKPAKSPSSAGAASVELSFEEALGGLERVVEAMESDDLPLDGLLARYEEGVRLLGVCQAKLAAAEVRIRQLEQAASGETVLAPLALSACAAAD